MKSSSLLGAALYLSIWAFFIITWFINAYQFFKCDFEPSYKEEIIKAVGIFIPPLNCVTVWF